MLLDSILSALQLRRTPKRTDCGHMVRRPRFEPLEDRCVLSLTPAVSYPVGANPQAAVAADFNNDGHVDLAVANRDSGDVSVLLGSENGAFGAATSNPVGLISQSIAVGDFDDDGNLDLAAVVADGGVRDFNGYLWRVESVVKVMFGNGDGSLQALSEIDVKDQYAWWKPQSLAVGDFNADGTMDIAVASSVDGYYPGDVYADFGQADVLLSNGDRTFSDPKVAAYLLYPGQSVVVADFNDDGNQDIGVGTNESLVGNGGAFAFVDFVRMAHGDGTGNFVVDSSNWVIDFGTSMVAGDVNGDVDVDLATADETKVNVRLGNGSGGFDPPRGGHSYVAGDKPTSAVLGDFDRDGVLDVATANYDSNNVSILRGRGDGAFLPAMNFAIPAMANGDFNSSGFIDGGDLGEWRDDFGANADSDADGDADSDGFDFLTWQRQLGQTSDAVEDVGPYAVVAGDFNGDGWIDLAAANANGNSVSVLFNDKTWEPLPAAVSVSIDNVTKQEGTGATTTTFTFTVSLSAAADEPVTMSYRTVYGSALDWPNTPWPDQNDYVAKTGTLSFAPGQTTKTISIEVKADTYIELDEIFYVDLFDSSSNSVFTKSYGIGTILNDDHPIPLFVFDIRFESKRGGKDWRAAFEIRSDSNADGVGTSSDSAVAGVQITVTFAGQTYTGTTDANGVFRTDWKINLANGAYYADVVDLALANYNWDPLGLDLEDDSDDDGLPDGILSVS